MHIFWNKNAKITSASGALPPNSCLPPVAGGSAPRLPCYYSYLLLQSLLSSFLVLNAFYYLQKEQNNCSKCSAFASFTHIFNFKLCSFVVGGHKNVSCPNVSCPSYATA